MIEPKNSQFSIAAYNDLVKHKTTFDGKLTTFLKILKENNVAYYCTIPDITMMDHRLQKITLLTNKLCIVDEEIAKFDKKYLGILDQSSIITVWQIDSIRKLSEQLIRYDCHFKGAIK